MAKVTTIHNNFSRGVMDHDMQGRVDLPIYQSGSDIFQNFISNFKGNAKYRTGFMLEQEYEDCRLIVFDFSINQNYLMLFTDNKIKFLTYDENGNFGFVQNGGGDFELATPYTLEEAKEIQFTQNSDVMVLTQLNHAPQDLIRVDANTFTIATHTTTGINLGVDGNPSCCTFQDGRLWFSGFENKSTAMRGSKVGDYEEFTVPATITDDSPINVTIAELRQPIEWLFAETTGLIAGNSQNLASLDGGSVGEGITADTVRATITKAEGSSFTYPINKEGNVFYIGKNNRHFYTFKYDLLEERYVSTDVNFISYDITKGGISKLAFKKDEDDLIYTVRNDGKLLSLNFQEKENIIGWHSHDTDGEFKDVAVMPNNEGELQLFALVLRNGVYYIERQAKYIEYAVMNDFFTGNKADDKEANSRFLSQQLRDSVYLDNSEYFEELNNIQITYSSNTITAVSPIFSSGDVGRIISYKTQTGYEKGVFEVTEYVSTTQVNVKVLTEPSQNVYDLWFFSFDMLENLDRFNGKEVAIVGDGVDLGDFLIENGNIDIERNIGSALVGLRYTPLIKSFSLGFYSQGADSNSKKKNIKRVWMRLTNSIGGLFGSSRYDLRNIELQFNSGINYTTELPLDGTSEPLVYSDNSEIDKFYYVTQDKAMPLNLCSLMIEADYEVRI